VFIKMGKKGEINWIVRRGKSHRNGAACSCLSIDDFDTNVPEMNEMNEMNEAC
jgi:hypothetical protein